MQRRTFMGALGAGALAVSGLAKAQGATTRVIVGATPGGGTDTVARTLAAEMGRVLGETFMVDNRPGAGGNIAAQEIARAKPDGRTLLMCYTSHAINATLYPNLPFDPVRGFTPISHVANAPSILVAHPSVKADDMAELIALAKAEPGALSMALPGIGSAGHLGAEVIKMQAGVDLLLVPYKGTAPAMNDLIGGQVSLMFAGAALAQGQLQAGALKPLGVSSARRMEEFPAIPPIADTLPGYDFSAWYGLLGPAGMDAAQAKRLSQAAAGVLGDPKIQRRLLDEGLIAVGSTPADFQQFLQTEISRWGKVVQASGARAG
ncbi:tripartite tricarboxylate transporter substrate binding protein [Bordetella sp. BOR01]|uniref:Bug family tripartite tricarboxylate transporter substrate binding protein n=1 Tax=Bordetella sp. BOR01 TaxID=2854779 RepID=UPI001C48C9B1|nr:tripartite tricarboxylate transporter substrate binding protein [Bordetella sp. BOR01]MBV7483945.1 tripartite tricarboxylate transporter substrate binding protein [Bordetella sp. BOR01]